MNPPTLLFDQIALGEISALTQALSFVVSLDRPRNSQGYTLIQWAALYGRTEAINALINAGAEVNTRNEAGGDTPLLLCIYTNNMEGALALCEAGADLSLTNAQQIAPLDYAISEENFECVEFLLEQGVDLTIPDQYGDLPEEQTENEELLQRLRSARERKLFMEMKLTATALNKKRM